MSVADDFWAAVVWGMVQMYGNRGVTGTLVRRGSCG